MIWLVVDQQEEISAWRTMIGVIVDGLRHIHITIDHLESQAKVQALVVLCLPVAIYAAMACSVA
jgi:hypothetical protein